MARIAAALAVAFPTLAALAQPACGPAPLVAGPSALVTVAGLTRPSGFSNKVTDSNGIALGPCLTGSGTPDGSAANPCIFSPVEPGDALSAGLGHGVEAFWFYADNLFSTSGPASVNGRVVMAIESTFTTLDVQDGFQVQFQRLRMRINVNAVGRYTVEHPWGQATYEVTSLLVGDPLSKSEINETVDLPLPLAQSSPGLVTPVLRWDPLQAPAPPTGFLGDGFTPHAVVGSPCGTIFVRISAVALDGTTPIAIDAGDADGDGRTDRYASRLFIVAGQVALPTLTANAAQLDFVAQSMGTTSPERTLTLSALGGYADVTSVAVSDAQFAQSNDCAVVPPGGHCTVSIVFSPSVAAGPLLARQPVEAELRVTSDVGGAAAYRLSGTAEKSLVVHYYQSILGRAPDAAGKAFWESEAARMQAAAVDVNEAWFAMAGYFFASAEYLAFARDDAGFATDLYRTFFNRAPDAGGLAFWTSELAAGLPREVALAGFLFSPEFSAFTQGLFGDTAAREEVDAVMDFYRGLLARLPDPGGLAYWVGRFRAAQCQGTAAIVAEADAISGLFATSPEYASRSRTSAQYVGDLYNAFLRRSGDRNGVQFWVDQVASGAMSRETVRRHFADSPEFSARVAAVAAQSCLN